MATKDERKAKLQGNGHNQVQGFVFGINLEGSEQVVMEGIKAFTHAMAKSGVVLTPPVVRPALSPGTKATTAAAVVDQVEEPDTTLEVPEEEPVVEASNETPSNGAERKRRIPPEPKVLNDLDITAGPMPLKTFVEQKGPKKSQDRLVVVAAWLKKHKGFEEITRDHLYTCYQQMGGSGDWKALNNFDVMLRQLGKRKSWFEKGKNEASFKVTIIASNYVDGMTPTSA
jgi:hypothetical protein